MTKGHFHQIVDTAEVYYTLKGEGYMMLENLDGDWRVERMEKGKALYVPADMLTAPLILEMKS